MAWERRFRTRAIWTDLHAGRYRVVFDRAHELLSEQPDSWERLLAVYCATQAAVDLGLNDRARALRPKQRARRSRTGWASVPTVDRLVASACRKLGARSRLQAAALVSQT
jgi:hypothetical protein